MDYSFYNSEDNVLLKKEKKKEIRKLGMLIGAAFICQVVLQNLLYLLINEAILGGKYKDNEILDTSLNIIYTIVGMLLPFYLFGKGMKKVSCVNEPLPLNAPKRKGEFLLAVIAGLGFCMIANIITSYITAFFELLGVTLLMPDVALPEGFSGFIITLVRTVICAAMVEEICVRGYIMGNLRAYGDSFAIAVSAIIFALMHGNLIQAPFALIAGAAIGYFTIKTGTMWTGIFIHALNNFISVCISYIAQTVPERAANVISIFVIYSVIMIGTLAFFLFFVMTRDKPLSGGCFQLSFMQKLGAVVLNPTMLISFAYMLYVTSLYIKIGR